MKKKVKTLPLLCLLFVIFSISCNKIEDPIPNPIPNPVPTEIEVEEGMMVLGEKLENAFSVENMQKAADSLSVRGILKSKIKIKTSHLYIRFIPKTA